MSGGGRGFCNPGWGGWPACGWGHGLGRGFRGGFGRGGVAWGGRFGPAYGESLPVDPRYELDMLRSEAAAAKSELDALNRRIEELASQSAESE